MGNIIPLDAAKKQQIEDIAKEFLATFTTEFTLAYGVEFVKMKLKQIDEETYGEENMKKELMYRDKLEMTDPHKMGYLTKKGAIVKNWKLRYFVVNPDYTVSYYESEEVYQKGGKPKGVINLAGYEVFENADNAAIEKLKKLAKILGLSENELPLPDKFPPHTLKLMHERRRCYYITATDEQDKKEWVEMFQTCCKKATGFNNKDPLAQAAFRTAYYRACQESNWYRRPGDCGGTEEQVLSETIVEIINYRVLADTYSSLSGNYTIRKKVRGQVIKVMDSMVLALVIPSYKALVESIQSLKGPLEKTIDEKKAGIVEVQKKITEALSDKMETIMSKVFEEVIADIKNMYEDLKEQAGKASVEMRKECVVGLLEDLIEETGKSSDVKDTIKKHYKIFDKVALSLWSWRHWYKVWNIEKGIFGIIRKYKDTFDHSGGYSQVYTSHDMLCEIADAAFFTFEETFNDRSKETDVLKDNKEAAELMASIKEEILPKYDHDSATTPEDISFKLTTLVVLEYVTKKIDPLTKDIRKMASDLVPEPLSKIVSIEDRYELYVEETIKGLIRNVIGESKTKQIKSEEKKEDTKKPDRETAAANTEKDEKTFETKNEGEDKENVAVNGEIEKGNEEEETEKENGEVKTKETKSEEEEDKKVEVNGEINKGNEEEETEKENEEVKTKETKSEEEEDKKVEVNGEVKKGNEAEETEKENEEVKTKETKSEEEEDKKVEVNGEVKKGNEEEETEKENEEVKTKETKSEEEEDKKVEVNGEIEKKSDGEKTEEKDKEAEKIEKSETGEKEKTDGEESKAEIIESENKTEENETKEHVQDENDNTAM